jgi:transposase
MLYVGLDLSRKRLDWQALLPDGKRTAIGAVPPDRDGLAALVRRLGDADEVVAVIESMSGARSVHDELERAGWDVRIADALKARGIAPLACKTDTIDTWVLAELARLALVPEIWLPDPEVRAERERARFRLHLVKHRSSLKNRIHAVLFQHGIPSPGSDLFGAGGRALLERLCLPEPWASTVAASLELIDVLDDKITACEHELRRLGAEHRYMPLLLTCPGIGWVLAFTIASEIGDIGRFASPRKLVGYSGLCPRVEQSASVTGAAPCARTGPTICAGRSSRPRTAPTAIRSTARSSSASGPSSAGSEERRSPRSRSAAGWRRRSGTCSPATSPLLRQAPPGPWPPDGPELKCATGAAPSQLVAHEGAIER